MSIIKQNTGVKLADTIVLVSTITHYEGTREERSTRVRGKNAFRGYEGRTQYEGRREERTPRVREKNAVRGYEGRTHSEGTREERSTRVQGKNSLDSLVPSQIT